MKKRGIAVTLLVLLAAMNLTGCNEAAEGAKTQTTEIESETESLMAAETEAGDQTSDAVASSDEMVTPEEVVDPDMVPIDASEVADGTYDVVVDSSSSMFNVVSCELTVADGKMQATMTMGGTGYLYVYPGTGEEAAKADESDYISYVENADGTHSFTVPVEALDQGIDLAAYSKRKEKWYDRTLVFHADSLPDGAILTADSGVTVTDLGLADGIYETEVTLSGGSGRASIASPATITIKDGSAKATIVWSSSNYDYMTITGADGYSDDILYTPVSGGPGTDENSTFEIPVAVFGSPISVAADTVAMSEPHEIAYTITFDTALKSK